MSKYWLAIFCALAFAAGGAAHMALNRPAEGAASAEFAPAKSTEPAPAEQPAPVQTAAQAQPADAVADGTEGTQPDEAEVAKAEDAAVSGGGAEVARAEAAVPRARRARAARTRRAVAAVQRPAVAQSSVATAHAPTRNAGSGRGLKAATAEGVRKTGSVLGRGLKKVGGIFND